MSKKSNVHPDHYKTDGRDRPDDAARARLNRAIAAKSLSRELPDRTGKRFYFERPEPALAEEEEAAGERLQKKGISRTRVAKKTGARKATSVRKVAARRGSAGKTAASRRRPPARKTTRTRRKAARTTRPAAKKK